MEITEIKLKNGEVIKFGNFNVFVGGNAVGKTTIILELFHKTVELPKNKYWWIDQITYASPNPKKDIIILNNSLIPKNVNGNIFFYSNAIKNKDGNIKITDDIMFSNKEKKEMSGNLLPITFKRFKKKLIEDKKYRQPFISFCSCESRLNLKSGYMLTKYDDYPKDPINVIHRNKNLFKKIDKIIFDIFKYHFIILFHLGTMLEIGISRSFPPDFNNNADRIEIETEKIEKWKESNFTSIEEAGHGIRSMIRLLISLLEPVNQIILIDEPEMHIYPSQKRWLGQKLVELAKEQEKQQKQIFLVTHDPIVLQGILDKKISTNVFRIDRDKEEGVINCCKFDKKTNSGQKQEQYLQGLFYQRCVVVEGNSDRYFYGEMFKNYKEKIQDKDLGFVYTGGDRGSRNMARLIANTKIKAVFIYDLDMIIKQPKLIRATYYILKQEKKDPIKNLYEAIRKNPKFDQKKKGEQKINIIKEITGYNSKSGFSPEWQKENKGVIQESLSNLEEAGIFMVPNGALESWCPQIKDKVRFAEQAPVLINKNPVLKKSFDCFAKKVLNSLDIEI